MRNKIDYGIDLGTTNSAIARMEDGVPIIKKSDTLKDTVPSCIHFNRKKNILVGDQAFNMLKNDNTRALKNFEKGSANTFIEFKRTMGTTHTYESTHMGKGFSSEELSAEILKKLKSFIQDENVSSVVITVPAKFLNPQNEATMKAAKLAGFEHVELLQEPVAAATAYGLGKKKAGYWLVFDFGGGTFDAALLKSDEGILTVKDTDGDNWLGGKNLDEAIVDQIIIPHLQKNFAVDNLLKDSGKKEILRNAVKVFAEEAKIQLSFKDTHHIVSNLGDLPFEDENGEEPEIDVKVTQQDMDKVVSPIFQKAIDITKALLERNNLKGSQLAALILVGGPTYSPILRRMLKEQITENVDTSIDPMTVVSRGAALFASTISVSEEVKETSRDKTKLQLDIQYEATTVEVDEMVTVKVLKEKTEGAFPKKIYADIERSDGAWSSGQQLIGEKASIIDLLLNEGQVNSFKINVFDGQGNRLACQPDQFTILQGIGGLTGSQVLPYNIGIGLYSKTRKKDVYRTVKGLEKNKKVPAEGVTKGLRTRQDIRPGMQSDTISIPIYQGDHGASGSDPILNNLITTVIISGADLPGLLPAGSDVNIKIEVNQSQLMTFTAEFPLLKHEKKMEIEIKQTEPPTETYLIEEITKAKQSAESIDADNIKEDIIILEKQLEHEKGSADGRMKILDGLRKILLTLDDAEQKAEWPKTEKKLKDSFYDFEELVKTTKANPEINLDMSKEEAEVNDYRRKIEYIVKAKDVKEAELLIEDIGASHVALEYKLKGDLIFIPYIVKYHNEFDSYHWKDRAKARQLITQGMQIIGKAFQLRDHGTEAVKRALSGISNIFMEVITLLPDDEKPNKDTLDEGNDDDKSK
ncbi:MAG: Hsp70 family protein [Tannerellaceae bacterium]|jgi:molecular chaperone DnaK|nr:Hsp70 family protein [Tannerellaceae bacterium]